MSGLAAMTKNASLVFSFLKLFRNPGLLAKAGVTIDHLSGGRADIGIGAGWFEEEFREFGYGFPPLGERFAQLEEALELISALWKAQPIENKGRFYDLRCCFSPQPLGLKLWIGGRGKDKTPRLAAKFADGFNMPYGRRNWLETACNEAEGVR